MNKATKRKDYLLPELTFIKHGGIMLAADPRTEEYVEKLKPGATIRAKFTKPRNPRFHRKLFSLFQLAFSQFEPQPYDHPTLGPVMPLRDFDTFRGDLLVKAGYYQVVGCPDGSVKLVPQSLAFDVLDDEEKFTEIYNAVVNVVLDDVLTGRGWSLADIEQNLNRLNPYL